MKKPRLTGIEAHYSFYEPEDDGLSADKQANKFYDTVCSAHIPNVDPQDVTVGFGGGCSVVILSVGNTIKQAEKAIARLNKLAEKF